MFCKVGSWRGIVSALKQCCWLPAAWKLCREGSSAGVARKGALQGVTAYLPLPAPAAPLPTRQHGQGLMRTRCRPAGVAKACSKCRVPRSKCFA